MMDGLFGVLLITMVAIVGMLIVIVMQMRPLYDGLGGS